LSFSFFAIDFISYNNFAHRLRLWLVDLFDPIFHIIKWFAVCNRIDKNDASCSLVVSLSDCFKSLLSSCIPNLHFDLDAIYINRFYFEVDSNCSHMSHFVLLIDISQ
jgi:hypothetical protein